MRFCSKLLVLALVLQAASFARAQEALGPLQGRTEKLANETGAATVGVGLRRAGRNPMFGGDDTIGAGFVIDEDGRILTAASLAPASGRIEVYFKGHHRAQATVVARDPRTHTALLKLNDVSAVLKEIGAKKLPYLRLGRSADLKLGRVVATLGNPFNSIQTDGVAAFSLGVVSSIGRVRDADNYKGQAIETDAAVNPGSFGGPLVDLEGKVVGIVIEPISTKRWLGIAIPIDEVTPILDDLKAGRSPAPPHLGLAVASAEPTLDGVKISDVESDGPASKAGIKTGDVLVSLDGVKVVEAFDIERELGLLSQGTPVELGVVREGKRLTVRVTLGASKEAENVSRTTSRTETETDAPPKTADGKPYLGIKVEEKEDGVYIKEVTEDGPAAKSKLAVGVKVIQINDVKVVKKQDMLDVLNKLSPGDKIKLSVENSEGFHKTVTIVLGSKGDSAAPPKRETAKSDKPGFLGVGCTKDEKKPGLAVQQVVEGSAAEKAKIEEGDSILELDGQKVDDFQVFTQIIRSKHAGETVKLKISHDGKERDVTVTLGERPTENEAPHPPAEEEKPAAKRPWVGFALSEKNGKIVVDEVADGSPAATAKIKAGFAIIGADGDDKITIDKLEKLIDSRKIGDTLKLTLENEEGFSKTITVTLGERPKDK
jgi:serine protease Do